jgi:hypothetical protein
MSNIPAGTELARPFLPTKDFELSKRFYEALGFEKVLDGEVAIFNVGSGGFMLQRYFQADWAANSMSTSACRRPSPRRCSLGGCASPTSWTLRACFGTLRSGATTPFRTCDQEVADCERGFHAPLTTLRSLDRLPHFGRR